MEKDFHRIREAFYIDEDFKSVIWINTEMGHEEYFCWIQHPEYIEEKVRGYVLNNHIVLYIGKDFRVPMTINVSEYCHYWYSKIFTNIKNNMVI